MTIQNQVSGLWDELPARFQFISVDSRGEIIAYTHLPRQEGETYVVEDGEYRIIERVKPRLFIRSAWGTAEHYTARLKDDLPELFTPSPAPAYTAEQLRGLVNNVLGEELENALLTVAEMIDLIHEKP